MIWLGGGAPCALAAPAGAAEPDAAARQATAAFAAPDWTLPTVAGGQVNLHERLGDGPVVVSFWATWCLPCLKEMPPLNEMAAEFAGQVTFIAVNVDQSRSVAKVAPLVRARGWNELIIALDTAGSLQQLLQVVNPPYLILYDTQGREAYRHEGYKEGDERQLRQALARVLAAAPGLPPAAAPGVAAAGADGAAWRDAVTATNQFKSSYSTETDAEIVENWLDLAYRIGGLRAGLLLNHQAPSEEGNRRAEIVHRYVELRSGGFTVRAGHFWGLFGRGLVWNSYADRSLRVDTALDGVHAAGRLGPLALQMLSGTTGTTPVFGDPGGYLVNSVDVRGADIEAQPLTGLMLGASGLTYVPRLLPADGEVRREWVGSGRLAYHHPQAALYLEYGRKTGYEFDPTTLASAAGLAFYGNLALHAGPVSVSVERSDYERFTVIERSDGTQPLNRPPALVREHLYTLPGRKPHALNQNDEKGWQLEAITALGRQWTLLGNLSRIETHDRQTLYEEAYGHLERENLGPCKVRGGFSYQDSEGALRQTMVGDASWRLGDGLALSAGAEHQHVRLGVLGAYDQQWFKLALDLPPRWTFDARLETNNKHPAQFDTGEVRGARFAAGQISYALAGGGNLHLWFGKRQAGQVCAGGVCKFEPAFSGVEWFGVLRF